MLRTAYVGLLHAIRLLTSRLGILQRLEHSRFWFLRHLRTLMAIYDSQDLASLGLPWWTYKATQSVDAFLALRPNARVFEFGAGASTLWLASRAAEVHSVEHDVDFADSLRSLLADSAGVTLHVVPPSPVLPETPIRSGQRDHKDLDFTSYVHTIDRVGGIFDLIVVDGRARVDAFLMAQRSLAPGGMIVFDDIHRRRYRDALEQDGWRVRVLRGAKPSLPYPDATGLLVRSEP